MDVLNIVHMVCNHRPRRHEKSVVTRIRICVIRVTRFIVYLD